jgi:hypothetical protein
MRTKNEVEKNGAPKSIIFYALSTICLRHTYRMEEEKAFSVSGHIPASWFPKI